METTANVEADTDPRHKNTPAHVYVDPDTEKLEISFFMMGPEQYEEKTRRVRHKTGCGGPDDSDETTVFKASAHNYQMTIHSTCPELKECTGTEKVADGEITRTLQ